MSDLSSRNEQRKTIYHPRKRRALRFALETVLEKMRQMRQIFPKKIGSEKTSADSVSD